MMVQDQYFFELDTPENSKGNLLNININLELFIEGIGNIMTYFSLDKR